VKRVRDIGRNWEGVEEKGDKGMKGIRKRKRVRD
jgi:hypothetical protein